MKTAIFLPNWIGDVVMATPALRAVRDRFPKSEIVGVMRPYVADVVAGTGLLDRNLLHDPRGDDPQRRGWRFARQLRRERFDLALLLPNSLRSGWLAWVSGAKRRVGFGRYGRSPLLTDALKPKPKSQPHPVLDEYLRLARHLGCDARTREMELATTDDDESRFEDFRRRHSKVLPRDGFVCLNPGGAFGAAKHWPSESFGRLAKRLVDELDKSVLILCGPAERETAREIARLAERPQRVVSLAKETPGIGLTKAAVKHAQLLITTDSGPRHFAPPFDVPVVTLFGPTHIEWSETSYPKATHLQIDVDCGPCQQRVCPLQHHRCMRDLTVDQVFAAAARHLSDGAQQVDAA